MGRGRWGSDNIKQFMFPLYPPTLVIKPFLVTDNKIQQGTIPERNSLANPTWSLSLAIATTRDNGASPNVIFIVFTKALADSLVWAGKHSKEL